jgi:hypothetical protein
VDSSAAGKTPPFLPGSRYVLSDGMVRWGVGVCTLATPTVHKTHAAPATPPQPVGIANTVSKHSEQQPLVPHLTPFEQRIDKSLREERSVAAAAAASSAAAAAAARHTPPGDGGGSSHIKIQLFAGDS